MPRKCLRLTKKQSVLLEDSIKMDIVISTALVPEKPAPKLISKNGGLNEVEVL